MTTKPPPPDGLWSELHAWAKRIAPRYGAEHGLCGVCGLGATRIEDLLGVWWARCDSCSTCWALGLNCFRAGNDEDEPRTLAPHYLSEITSEFAYQTMLEYAGLTRLPANTGVQHMTQQSEPSAQIDPRLFQPRGADPLWPETRPALRAYVLRRVLEIVPHVQEIPVANGRERAIAVQRIWNEIRNEQYGDDGVTVDAALSAPVLGGPSKSLNELLLLLFEAGSLRATLLKHREAINATLAALEGLGARR